MADVVDDFGRVTRLKADLESLSESLRSAVGKAVEYASGRAKENTDDLKVEFEKLADAMEELGDDVKESLKSTREFVEEVKKAAESVDKARSSRSEVGRDKLADAQKEQTRILQMLLRSHQKAVSEKAAKFTSGGTVLSNPEKRRPALKEMGFRPRGADKIPAMVSPGEFVVSKKGARGNEGLLDRINRGYMRGGKVKPEYLAGGSNYGGRRWNASMGSGGRVHIVVEGPRSDEVEKQLREEFGRLGQEVSVDFSEKFDREFKKRLSTWAGSFATAITGRGDPWQTLFEGAVKDVTEFRREMRNLAFQTEGITGNFREAQAEFARIGTDIAGRTGVSVTAFQKAYMNNARKGFKDQKAGMKVLESGLKLSTLIGSETQATASLFADWHRELGLGAVQMERMANNMQMVARNTGVTGDELVEVMKSSEQILKNLRNQGTLTTTAARNVTQAMAEYKKQGFAEEGQKMLAAMSGYSAFMDSDKGTQTLLQLSADRGGVNQLDMMHGEALQDPEKMGRMATGMRDFLAQQVGFKPEDYDKFDMELINESQRKHLTYVLGSMGKSIGEVDSTMKNLSKGAKGLGGELSDLSAASKSATATQEQRKQAEKNMNDKILAASMDQLGSIVNAAEKFQNKDMAGLAEELKNADNHKFAKDFQNSARDLAQMAPHLSDSIKRQFGLSGSAGDISSKVSSMDTENQIKMMSLASAEQIDKALAAQGKGNQDFSKRMQAAMAKNDIEAMKSISSEMTAARQGLQVDEAAKVDPMEKLEQTMNKLNGTIRSAFSPLTGAVLDLIGWVGLLGVQFGMMGTSLANFFGGPVKWLSEGGLGNYLMKGPLGPFFKGFTKEMQKTGSLLSSISRGVGLQSRALTWNPAVGAMGQAVKKALGPAIILLGGIKGAMEAREAGRTKTEGAILGALTGGAGTGSFLSPMLGVQKGSATDKTLGVAGAAAWGASAGAALSLSLGGLDFGTSILIGAIIGGVTEVVKIITEGTDILADLFAPFQAIGNWLSGILGDLWRVLKSFATLNPVTIVTEVVSGIVGIISKTVYAFFAVIFGAIRMFVIGLPRLILRAFEMLWELPRMFMESIKNALAGLANNEWFGPIFKTLSVAFDAIYDGFMAIWTPISQIFSGLGTVFGDLGQALFGSAAGGSVLSGIMWTLQKAVWGVSYVISWLISPVILLAKALGFVLQIVGKLIQGIIYPFQYLYEVLVGHSIVPDLVFGIIQFFAMLPIRIFKFLATIPYLIGKALLKVPEVIGSAFLNMGSYIRGLGLGGVASFFIKTVKKIPVLLLRGMKAVFYDFPSWLMGKLMDGVWAVGNFLVLSLPKIMWQAFKNSLSAVGKFVWDTLSWPFRKIGELMNWVWESIKQKTMEAWEFVKGIFDMGAWGSWIAGLGTQVYEGLTSSLQGVWDWIKSWIPGLGTVSKAWEKTKNAAGTAWEGAKSTGKKAWEGLKAAGSYLNPFSYFEGYKQGTKKIEKPGLAMLHAGEMVVPKNVLDKMSAMGNGVFGSISSMVMGKKNAGGTREGGLISSLSDRIRGMGEMFQGCCPGEAIEGLDGALKGVPKVLEDALAGADEGSFFGRMKERFNEAQSYTDKFFKPLTLGFKRARKNGEGFLSSISKGMKYQVMSMSHGDGIMGKLSNPMNWLSKSIFGESEGKDTKKGIFQRIKDGIFGSKEGEETKKGILDVIKSGLFGEGGEGMKKGIFQIMKEGLLGGEEGGGLYGWIKGKVFGQKMEDGEHGPPKPGLADAAKVTAKSLWESTKRRFEINTEDGMINGAKNAAKKMYSKAKDRLFGKSMADGEMGPPKPGMLDKAKGRISEIYGKAKGRVFGSGPAEAIDSASKADSRTPGKLEAFKDKMKNIAEGIKEFSGSKVLAGALNLIPSSVGLVAMIPGSVGARMLSIVDGKKLQSSLEGIGRGVSALGEGKVLLGAAAMLAVGVASIGMIPAIPVLIALGAVGPLVEKGLKSLGKGLSVFGKAAANPYTWLGVLLLGALNVAMIPLAYAIGLLSPAIEAFGKAIKSAFEGAGSMLRAVGESIGLILKEITMSKALALGVAALGIAALGAAMVAFAGGGFIASWLDYFSGDGLFDKIMEFAAMSSNLMMAATAVDILGRSFKNFAANKSGGWAEWFAGSDGVIEGFRELSKLGTPEFVATADAIHRMGEGIEKIHSIPMAKPTPGDATTATTPVGDALPTLGSGASAVEPVHLRDITGSILRDRAGSGGNKLHSDELSRMEEASNRQVSELEQIRQGIQELVSLMRPSGGVVGDSGGSGTGSTKDPRRPMHAARFGKMKFGVPGGLANRSVVNTGEV